MLDWCASSTRRALVTALTVALPLGTSGCLAAGSPSSAEPMSPPQARENFQEAIAELQGEYGGEGKADLFGVDPCRLIAPLVEHGEQGLRSGFFLGVEGQGVLGSAVALGGFDIVWDIYHQQMTVSRYLGAGVGTPGLGASVEAYVGYARGFQEGVSDWDGYFVTFEGEVGLPFLREYLSLGAAVFVSGQDTNGDHVISPSEVLLPPEGVYGFQVGVELGVEVPTGLPVAGSATEGLWEPHKPAIRYYYDLFRDTRFARVGSTLSVRLVDHHSGEPCDEQWPDVDAERDCIIEFGDPSWSYTRRALHLAYSVCTATGGCEIPLSWPLGASAVAVGALRDAGGALSRFCPDVSVGGEEEPAGTH